MRCPVLACALSGCLVAGAWGQTTTRAATPTPIDLGGLTLLPAAPESTRDQPRASFVLAFFDDFSRGAIDPRKWARIDHVTRVGAADGGGVRLGSADGDRSGELRSTAIDLSRVPTAALSIRAAPTALDTAAALGIDYFASDREWRSLDRLVAGSWPPSPIAASVYALPDDALHAEFAFRLRTPPGAVGGWHVAEASVRVPTGLASLVTVDSVPVWGARVRIVVDDQPLVEPSGATPFVRGWSSGSRLKLIAAAEVAGWVFDRWSVQGELQPAQQRVVSILLADANVSAVAQYRRGSADDVVTLTIRSAPRGDVRIAVGHARDEIVDEVDTDDSLRCLAGETVFLVAPPRTDRMVFSHWTIAGRDLPDGVCTLVHRVASGETATAVYVRLGDMNDDDVLDRNDVDAFVLALVAPHVYERHYPAVNRERRGDVNGDGSFDERDIESFVDLLLRD